MLLSCIDMYICKTIRVLCVLRSPSQAEKVVHVGSQYPPTDSLELGSQKCDKCKLYLCDQMFLQVILHAERVVIVNRFDCTDNVSN